MGERRVRVKIWIQAAYEKALARAHLQRAAATGISGSASRGTHKTVPWHEYGECCENNQLRLPTSCPKRHVWTRCVFCRHPIEICKIRTGGRALFRTHAAL